MGFLGSSDGKESACNAGDPSYISGSGRSPGEGIGYPLQYSWASLVAQAAKNPPATLETWICSLGWKDPLEKGMAIRSSFTIKKRQLSTSHKSQTTYVSNQKHIEYNSYEGYIHKTSQSII